MSMFVGLHSCEDSYCGLLGYNIGSLAGDYGRFGGACSLHFQKSGDEGSVFLRNVATLA